MDYEIVWNGYTVCPEDWGMTNASEVFHRIYYVYGGEAYCSYNNRLIRLLPKHIYIFPVMQPYSLWQNTQDSLDVLWFHVETDRQLSADLEEWLIEDHSIEYHVLEALRILSESGENFEKIKHLFGLLLMQMSERLPLCAKTDAQMDTILAYIETHITNDLTVQALADHIGMERAYFARKFKQLFHMTPHHFIIAKRMRLAADQLMKGASVYEAAKTAGYTDEKAFSRTFKRYMEISPGRYRKAHWTQP